MGERRVLELVQGGRAKVVGGGCAIGKADCVLAVVAIKGSNDSRVVHLARYSTESNKPY
jgi:hypothetical protein